MNSLFNTVCDPLDAKLCFQSRTLVNFVLSAGTCALILLPLGLVVPLWMADLIAYGAALYVFAAFLNKRPIGIRCEHCRHIVLSNTPWVCGFCSGQNMKPDEHSFLFRCEHCSASPKAYKCHHSNCGQLIFLSEDRLEANYARCVGIEKASATPTRQSARLEEQEEKVHAINMAELDAKLEVIKKRPEKPKVESILDQKKKSLEDHFSSRMGARELAKKKREEAAAMFKDAPDRLEEANLAIDEWLEENG